MMVIIMPSAGIQKEATDNLYCLFEYIYIYIYIHMCVYIYIYICIHVYIEIDR